MNANDTIYELKRVNKLLNKRKIDLTDISSKLSNIISECDKRNLKKEKIILFNIISKLTNYQDHILYINSNISNLIKNFKIIREKEKVMEIREARARATFFKHTPCYKKSLDSDITLKYGDIVRVPTQGGMHYSIIVNVNENTVECLPITTSDKLNLDMINVKSMPIGEINLEDGSFSELRITNSFSQIPAKSAQVHKVGTYDNITHLSNILRQLLEN